MTQLNLPRLLLVTEAPLHKNSTGIDRTLFNLLDTYPPDKFALYTQKNSSLLPDTSPPLNQNVITFRSEFIPYFKNRLGLLLNNFIASLNFQILDWQSIANLEPIEQFNPNVILICPSTPAAMILGYRLARQLGCPYIIYFMDDWIAKVQRHWLSNNVQRYAKQVLQNAKGWLMISSQLERDLKERYRIIPKSSLIVHNPVDLSSLPPPDFSIHQGTFKVIYAGSIWIMHYDAIKAVAEAIFDLRREGYDIELILHTPPLFWHQYQDFWESHQVINGGMIPYDDLHLHLQQGDLLLVASSFIPELAHVTRSSVQTKITDYMASGRPILAFGPDYSACNQFLKAWKSSLVCDEIDLHSIKAVLFQAITDRSINQSLGHQAYRVVMDHFDKQIISHDLSQFITLIYGVTS